MGTAHKVGYFPDTGLLKILCVRLKVAKRKKNYLSSSNQTRSASHQVSTAWRECIRAHILVTQKILTRPTVDLCVCTVDFSSSIDSHCHFFIQISGGNVYKITPQKILSKPIVDLCVYTIDFFFYLDRWSFSFLYKIRCKATYSKSRR